MDTDALIADRKASPELNAFLDELKAKDQSVPSVRKAVRDVEAFMENPYGAVSVALEESPGLFGRFSPTGRNAVHQRLARKFGLVPTNPKYQTTTKIDLSGEPLPYRTAAMDFRVPVSQVEKFGYSKEDYYNEVPIFVQDGDQRYDLTDPAESFAYFKASQPDNWTAIQKRAGVNTSDPESVLQFDDIVRKNISLYLRKGIL